MHRAFHLWMLLGLAGGLSAAVPEIVPQQVAPVNGPEHFQPSGLAVVDGALFTVSDKHDQAIYALTLADGECTARPVLEITGLAETRKLDLEGLVTDGAGGFFVVSEEHCRLLHVPAAGDAKWLTPDLRNDPAVQSAGLLVKHNACFEGLAQLAPGDFLFAAERDPRGLVEVDLSRQPPAVSAVKMKRSPHAEEGGRKPDFADLAVWRGRVFALVRNLSLVCELVRDPSSKKGWREGAAFSYVQTENDPRYVYTDTKYGLGEGLALDDEHLYLVFDNNDDALASAPTDRRARLFVFANPFATPAK